jgi:hypothetical protein
MPVCLTQENGFLGFSIISQLAVAGKRHSSAYAPGEKECNKYDLTAAQCF